METAILFRFQIYFAVYMANILQYVYHVTQEQRKSGNVCPPPRVSSLQKRTRVSDEFGRFMT